MILQLHFSIFYLKGSLFLIQVSNKLFPHLSLLAELVLELLALVEEFFTKVFSREEEV